MIGPEGILSDDDNDDNDDEDDYSRFRIFGHNSPKNIFWA